MRNLADRLASWKNAVRQGRRAESRWRAGIKLYAPSGLTKEPEALALRHGFRATLEALHEVAVERTEDALCNACDHPKAVVWERAANILDLAAAALPSAIER